MVGILKVSILGLLASGPKTKKELFNSLRPRWVVTSDKDFSNGFSQSIQALMNEGRITVQGRTVRLK